MFTAVSLCVRYGHPLTKTEKLKLVNLFALIICGLVFIIGIVLGLNDSEMNIMSLIAGVYPSIYLSIYIKGKLWVSNKRYVVLFISEIISIVGFIVVGFYTPGLVWWSTLLFVLFFLLFVNAIIGTVCVHSVASISKCGTSLSVPAIFVNICLMSISIGLFAVFLEWSALVGFIFFLGLVVFSTAGHLKGFERAHEFIPLPWFTGPLTFICVLAWFPLLLAGIVWQVFMSSTLSFYATALFALGVYAFMFILGGWKEWSDKLMSYDNNTKNLTKFLSPLTSFQFLMVSISFTFFGWIVGASDSFYFVGLAIFIPFLVIFGIFAHHKWDLFRDSSYTGSHFFVPNIFFGILSIVGICASILFFFVDAAYPYHILCALVGELALPMLVFTVCHIAFNPQPIRLLDAFSLLLSGCLGSCLCAFILKKDISSSLFFILLGVSVVLLVCSIICLIFYISKSTPSKSLLNGVVNIVPTRSNVGVFQKVKRKGEDDRIKTERREKKLAEKKRRLKEIETEEKDRRGKADANKKKMEEKLKEREKEVESEEKFRKYRVFDINPKYIKVCYETLGSGGFGSIHEGKYKKLHVVIKKVKKTAIPLLEEKEELYYQWKIYKAFQHQFCPVPVPYGRYFDEEEDRLCLVMEYCKGGSIWDIFQGGNSMYDAPDIGTEDGALQAVSICSGMICSTGIIIQEMKKFRHLDLKPENFFIRRKGKYGEVIVGDLGFAKVESTLSRSTNAKQATRVSSADREESYCSDAESGAKNKNCAQGDPHYWPLEICENLSNPTKLILSRCDSYALGLCIYYVFSSGNLAFSYPTSPLNEKSPEFMDQVKKMIRLREEALPKLEDTVHYKTLKASKCEKKREIVDIFLRIYNGLTTNEYSNRMKIATYLKKRKKYNEKKDGEKKDEDKDESEKDLKKELKKKKEKKKEKEEDTAYSLIQSISKYIPKFKLFSEEKKVEDSKLHSVIP
ncbi:hypothetical protein ADUPG1_011953 [Aduncisulcus paluster]|uniref:Protein kinase domain-containing protein n=1 Tax=Aduncisulcus paluster TaxID=2918883 RepID=A0ABQ5K1X7_9EUKA|nr:hypothetical protein ADUPG1_011953 [Aduncisulcus paluster]